ncbi:MAG: PDZ domain-containing protein [bacterium]|nr:PDZ domain-containing protein [bacterium]
MKKARFILITVVAMFLPLPASGAEDRQAQITQIAQTDEAEITFWQSVKDSKEADELEAYLQAFPSGKFAPLAKIRLKKLKINKAAAPVPSQKDEPRIVPAGKNNTEKADIDFKLLEKVVTATLGARADDKNRSWLGVKIATLPKVAAATLQIPVATATIITSVFKNSAAEKAGLAVGNIVISVDGVVTPDSRSLAREVAGHRAGEQIEIKFLEPAKSSAEIVQRLKEKEKNSEEGALADFLADSYRYGFFGTKDVAETVSWYQRSAKKGNTGALHSLATMYDKGDGVAENRAEAVKWYRKAAEKGHVGAMYRLGYTYAYSKDKRIGRDAKKAMKWFHRAAEKGHASAMDRLGFIYSFGKSQEIPGVVVDGEKAVKWYKKAAEKGLSDSMASLGHMYQLGFSIRKDYAKALKWYRKAEAKGNVRALYHMGTMYDAGTGVSKGPETAAWYLLKSYKGGYSYVREILFEKSSTLSTSTRKAIQKILKEEGVYSSSADGKFGPGTRRALEAFKAKADAATQAKKKPVKSMSEEFGDIKELEKLD